MGRLVRPKSPGLGLGPGGEFDLIRSFFDLPAGPFPAGVRIGVGDDCAVVAGNGIALSTDMSVEGVHFRREWMSLDEIGYRATTAALSDLAAVAARPIGGLVSLALPPAGPSTVGGELMSGARKALELVGGMLLGGDLVASTGPLVIDVAVVGEAPKPVLRSGALPGDELWITGEIGAAGLAVREWLAGRAPAPDARTRFVSPVARVSESRWLAERGLAHAMIDLSDGLAGDAAHIAAAGGVGIEIEMAVVPVHPAVSAASDSIEAALLLALTGGEDYELCFAAPAGKVEHHRADFETAFGVRLTRVGQVVEAEGVTMRDIDGGVFPMNRRGYQHFEDRV